MSTTNDGGQAYPSIEQHGDKSTWTSYPGMSLRDYFAGQVIVEIISPEWGGMYDEMSVEAYKVADAMLKAREEVAK